MKTLLIIAPPKSTPYGDCLYNLLVAETGEFLASHLCSSSGYAMGDLYTSKPERIEEYTKRFGDIEVKFIDETDIEISELQERNKIWFNSLEKTTNENNT